MIKFIFYSRLNDALQQYFWEKKGNFLKLCDYFLHLSFAANYAWIHKLKLTQNISVSLSILSHSEKLHNDFMQSLYHNKVNYHSKMFLMIFYFKVSFLRQNKTFLSYYSIIITLFLPPQIGCQRSVKFFKIILFCNVCFYFFLAALSLLLPRLLQFGGGGHSLAAVPQLLIAGLAAAQALGVWVQKLHHVGSVVAALGSRAQLASSAAHRFSYPEACCGIFLDQGWKLCLLQWQMQEKQSSAA